MFFADTVKCFDKLWLKDCLFEMHDLGYDPREQENSPGQFPSENYPPDNCPPGNCFPDNCTYDNCSPDNSQLG